MEVIIMKVMILFPWVGREAIVIRASGSFWHAGAVQLGLPGKIVHTGFIH